MGPAQLSLSPFLQRKTNSFYFYFVKKIKYMYSPLPSFPAPSPSYMFFGLEMIPSGYRCLNWATTSGSSKWMPSSWLPRVILKRRDGSRKGGDFLRENSLKKQSQVVSLPPATKAQGVSSESFRLLCWTSRCQCLQTWVPP